MSVSDTEFLSLLEAKKTAWQPPLGFYRKGMFLFEDMQFKDLTAFQKGLLAEYYIVNGLSRIGAASIDSDLFHLLASFAAELQSDKKCEMSLPGTNGEAVAFAVRLICPPNDCFRVPSAAVAAVYLVTQLEGLFKALSGYLRFDGNWTDRNLPLEASQHLHRQRNEGRPVSRLKTAYDLFLLGDLHHLVEQFRRLDAVLPDMTVRGNDGGKKVLSTLGERMDYMRNHAAHGQYGDISAEVLFFASVFALTYFSNKAAT